MKISNHCDCPECGPYVPTRRTRSFAKRLTAQLLGCCCLKCRDCGTAFLIPNPASLWGRVVRLPLGMLKLR